VCAALGFRWDGQRHQLWFRTAPGDCNRHRVLAFVKALARHVRGRRVILIWDQLPAHKSVLVRDYLCAQQRWLRIEWLPGYAPELNPAEPLWGNIKGRELANCHSEDLADAAAALRRSPTSPRRSCEHRAFFLIELSPYYTRFISPTRRRVSGPSGDGAVQPSGRPATGYRR